MSVESSTHRFTTHTPATIPAYEAWFCHETLPPQLVGPGPASVLVSVLAGRTYLRSRRGLCRARRWKWERHDVSATRGSEAHVLRPDSRGWCGRRRGLRGGSNGTSRYARRGVGREVGVSCACAGERVSGYVSAGFGCFISYTSNSMCRLSSLGALHHAKQEKTLCRLLGPAWVCPYNHGARKQKQPRPSHMLATSCILLWMAFTMKA
jgi:hypothetical protein